MKVFIRRGPLVIREEEYPNESGPDMDYDPWLDVWKERETNP